MPTLADRRGRRAAVAVGLVVLTLIFFALFVDFRAAAAQVRAARPGYLAFASGALLAGLVIYALRWRWLLDNGPSWWRSFDAANLGHAVNLLLPLRMGDAARIVVLARDGQPPLAVATASVVVERLLEQIMRLGALGGAIALGLGVAASPVTVIGAIVLIGLVLAALVWLRRRPAQVLCAVSRLGRRVPRLHEAAVGQMLTEFQQGLELAGTPGRLAVALAFSAAAWICFWAFGALALCALPTAPEGGRLLALSLGALALAPASAPAQPGIYHAAIVVPLAVAGFGETTLTAYAIVLHALLMAWMLALGLVGLIRSGAPVLGQFPDLAT